MERGLKSRLRPWALEQETNGGGSLRGPVRAHVDAGSTATSALPGKLSTCSPLFPESPGWSTHLVFFQVLPVYLVPQTLPHASPTLLSAAVEPQPRGPSGERDRVIRLPWGPTFHLLPILLDRASGWAKKQILLVPKTNRHRPPYSPTTTRKATHKQG